AVHLPPLPGQAAAGGDGPPPVGPAPAAGRRPPAAVAVAADRAVGRRGRPDPRPPPAAPPRRPRRGLPRRPAARRHPTARRPVPALLRSGAARPGGATVPGGFSTADASPWPTRRVRVRRRDHAPRVRLAPADRHAAQHHFPRPGASPAARTEL